MLIRLTGTSFRDNKLELPIGTILELRPDPKGKATGQKHNDENAISVWFTDSFLGYIPKDKTHNKFDKVTVSSVWYKSPKKSVQGVTTTYSDGDIIAGIEVECEGEFQITTDTGRTYELEGESYDSITTVLKKYPSDPDSLIRWALGEYDTYDEYTEGLNRYAEAGTELHNKIEEYLGIRKKAGHDVAEESGVWGELPENVQNFFLSLGDFEVISIESNTSNKDLKIAGRGDAVLKVKDEKIAFDWKSSKSVNVKHRVQVGFYADSSDCDLGCVVAFGANNKQGYSVSWVNPKKAIKILEHLQEIFKLEKQLIYKK